MEGSLAQRASTASMSGPPEHSLAPGAGQVDMGAGPGDDQPRKRLRHDEHDVSDAHAPSKAHSHASWRLGTLLRADTRPAMSSDLAVMTWKHPALHVMASTADHAARLRPSFGG